MSDSRQAAKKSDNFELGPLGTMNQVIKALGKTIRAMADGTIDSQQGARICNGLGIMRACLETVTLERLERRLDEIEGLPNTAALREEINDRRPQLQ
jgi:hypothetical protein